MGLIVIALETVTGTSPDAYSSAEPALSGADAERSQSGSGQPADASRGSSARARRRAPGYAWRHPSGRRTVRGAAGDDTAGDSCDADDAPAHGLITISA